jgi:hypothetical protein
MSAAKIEAIRKSITKCSLSVTALITALAAVGSVALYTIDFIKSNNLNGIWVSLSFSAIGLYESVRSCRDPNRLMSWIAKYTYVYSILIILAFLITNVLATSRYMALDGDQRLVSAIVNSASMSDEIESGDVFITENSIDMLYPEPLILGLLTHRVQYVTDDTFHSIGGPQGLGRRTRDVRRLRSSQ